MSDDCSVFGVGLAVLAWFGAAIGVGGFMAMTLTYVRIQRIARRVKDQQDRFWDEMGDRLADAGRAAVAEHGRGEG